MSTNSREREKEKEEKEKEKEEKEKEKEEKDNLNHSSENNIRQHILPKRPSQLDDKFFHCIRMFSIMKEHRGPDLGNGKLTELIKTRNFFFKRSGRLPKFERNANLGEKEIVFPFVGIFCDHGVVDIGAHILDEL